MARNMHKLVFLVCLIVPCMTLPLETALLDKKKNVTRKVRCTSRAFPFCFFVWKNCPDECPTNCVIDCGLCKPVCTCNRAGAICQDPRFVGGDGVTFYFHGRRDADFCLVSDDDLHINAHFIGKRVPNMKRDFTWVQSVNVLFGGGRHRLSVGALKTEKWDDAVDRLSLTFDGRPVSLPPRVGATWRISTVSFTRTTHDVNSVMVAMEGRFSISAAVVPITDEDSRVHRYNVSDGDRFAHLDLGFKFHGLTERVDGILGRTYRRDYVNKVKVGAAMPVVGGEEEFEVSGAFATDCWVSRYRGGGGAIAATAELAVVGVDGGEYGRVECKSGGSGRGVVCKR
ncbi:hypothetical protein QJS04_geneDACA008441 [Acorus gramineus]|uniref:Uncharacterized protein n=1 Tax=Acorus gramineus TaxID=55184 RepID=A0AAV9AIZ6_ACOGR|nr:hypothetical protein QJS04_geneDACA008441 [Acorus gramineus]